MATLGDIAAALVADVAGDAGLKVDGAAEPRHAGPRDIAVALSQRFIRDVQNGRARCAILPIGTDWQALGLDAAVLLRGGPRRTLVDVTAIFAERPDHGQGIHPTAIVDPGADLRGDVTIAAHAVIGAGVRIGAGCIIGPGCFVGQGTRIGNDAILHPGVRIGAHVTIGDNFIAQPGAVIGFDGASYVTDAPSNAEVARRTLGHLPDPKIQPWHKAASIGGVVIGDDVEIGANTCVDAGTLSPTRIGTGTKIDNLCQIAHNVEVGAHCFFAAMVGVAGSTRIGDHVILGGQTGIGDNLIIGDCVVAGGGSGILTNQPAGRVVLGYPATPMARQLESYRALRRLPRILARLGMLQKSVFKRGDRH